MRAGNQYSSATTYVSCYANIMAKVFATAIAEASASASCGVFGGDAMAPASILAEVRAELQQVEFCTIDITSVGNAGGSAGGSGAITFPVRLTPYTCRNIRSACMHVIH